MAGETKQLAALMDGQPSPAATHGGVNEKCQRNSRSLRKTGRKRKKVAVSATFSSFGDVSRGVYGLTRVELFVHDRQNVWHGVKYWINPNELELCATA